MFRNDATRLIDLQMITFDEMQFYFPNLRKHHPKRSHFNQNVAYFFRDEMGVVSHVKFKQDLFLICYENAADVWCMGVARTPLMGVHATPDCFLAHSVPIAFAKQHADSQTRLIKQPAPMVAFHVVNVDFYHKLNQASGRYFATHLKGLVESFALVKFNKGSTLIELNKSTFLMLTLSHSLVPRPSSKHRDQMRYAIVRERPLGVGAYSKVYDNPETLRVVPGVYTFPIFNVTKNPRVMHQVEIEADKAPFAKERMARETEVLKRMTHLKSKPYFFKPSFNVDGEVAFRFEKKIQGRHFESYLQEGLSDWSLMTRLRFAIAVLTELHEAVHEKGVIHCDIKPDNFMVIDKDALFPTVRFIDFNYSRLKTDKCPPETVQGSPLYLAPERFQLSIPDVASDVFSMGVMLGELFGATIPLELEDVEDVAEYAQNYQFYQLFSDLPEGNDDIKEQIADILSGMVSPDPKMRPTPRAVADQLDQVLLKMIAEETPWLQNRRPGFGGL